MEAQGKENVEKETTNDAQMERCNQALTVSCDAYLPLVLKYPEFFKKCETIDCGPGWYKLIEILTEKIIKICKREQIENVYPIAIKEKFGSLRYFLSSENDEINDLIDEAIKDSESTCTQCGKEGRVGRESRLSIPYSWISCLCIKCRGGKKCTMIL
jgi:hypothetical protein